jgi:glycosyltransferase involved in cell wall biosynthesis
LEGTPDPRVKFAIQWVHDFTDRDGALVKKDPWLEGHPQVDFIQGYFDPNGGYVRALRNTDLMLLPYRDAYRYRLSRVLLEAIISGIPAMVSKETTLAEQVAEHGAGIEFDQDSADAMVKSIEECVRRYPELKRQALVKARSSREHFSVAHFRSNLVGLLRGNSAAQRIKILYLCSSDEGGLVEYSLRQAAALAALPGVEVLWKAPESVGVPPGAKAMSPLVMPAKRKRNSVGRFLAYFQANVAPWLQVTREAMQCKPDAVLVSSWHEYFAPFWAPRMRRLRQTGIRIGAVIHDPVRDHIVGPAWWHRWSVREAYSFLDVAFSHDSTAPDSCGSKRRFDVLQIPQGTYELPDGGLSRDEVRRELGIPAGAKVMLSFGHIRNGKKLDQVIAALPSLPGTHLLVAGREQSEGQKPAEYYRKLAVASGVADRCHFYTSYIPNGDVWKFFRASDLLVLTYSADFRSASGVLNVNAQFGLPVLVSAGRSPLLDAVRKYGLGTVIERPDAKLIADAVPGTLGKAGDWPCFCADSSWARNAEIVAEAFSQAMRR